MTLHQRNMSGPQSILLIANYQPDQQQSMLRFASLLDHLLTMRGIPHRVWHPPVYLGSFFRSGGISKLAAYVDKFLIGGLMLAVLRWRYDVFHILDHSNSLYTFFIPPARTLVTCHDCIAIEEATIGRTGERVGRFGPLLQRWISVGLRRAGRVAAVSHETARELQRHAKVPLEYIQVVHNTLYSDVARVDPSACKTRLAELGLPADKGFIFMLGSNLIRKNRVRAMQAYELLRRSSSYEIQLVMAGKPLAGAAREQLRDLAYARDIHFLGTIDDQTLSVLYSSCSVFFFPSLAEGFGVPIIEAQACGAAVVTSNIEPMPEVGGSASIYADPYDIESLAAALHKALSEREVLGDLSKENVLRFAPEVMCNGYVRLYQELTQ